MRSSLAVPMFCHGRRGSAHLPLIASIQTTPVATERSGQSCARKGPLHDHALHPQGVGPGVVGFGTVWGACTASVCLVAGASPSQGDTNLTAQVHRCSPASTERQTIFGTASATEFDRHGIGYSWSAARWKTRRQSQRKKAMSIRSTRLWMACPSLPEQMP